MNLTNILNHVCQCFQVKEPISAFHKRFEAVNTGSLSLGCEIRHAAETTFPKMDRFIICFRDSQPAVGRINQQKN